MAHEGVTEQPAGSASKSEAWEWGKAILIAGVLVLIIRFFIFQPFIVEGPSMHPNFQSGERLIVNKLIYTIRHPHRGEVLVFHAPDGRDYIKRVIALPGETIKIENNRVYVNHQEIPEPYIHSAVEENLKKGVIYNMPFPETKVPEGTVFAMGDNRLNSSDSRMENVGPVPFNKIVGRADIIFWPLQNMTFVKHH
jgi:signal peptidase I